MNSCSVNPNLLRKPFKNIHSNPDFKLFVIIGSILSFILGGLLPVHIIETKDNITLNYGLVGLGLALHLIFVKKTYKDNKLLFIYAFTVSGMAYSHFTSEYYDGNSNYYFFISFALAAFVFNFCITFLSFPNVIQVIKLLALCSIIPLVISVQTLNFLEMKLAEGYIYNLVHYLIISVAIAQTFLFIMSITIDNVFINLINLFIFFVAIPLILTFFSPNLITYYLLILSSIIIIIILVNNLSVKETFKGIFAIYWIASYIGILANYLIVSSFISVVIYIYISRHFHNIGYLLTQDRKRSQILSITSFFIQLGISYGFILLKLMNLPILPNILLSAIIWFVLGFLASFSLGYCIFICDDGKM